MLVSTHIIISFIIALVLYPFFGLYSIAFFLAGFLIDFDHYLEYVIMTKNINPFKAYSYFIKIYQKNQKNIIKKKQVKWKKVHFHMFHTFEFILIIGIISFFSKIVLFVFFGLISHFILDFAYNYYLKIKFKQEFCNRCHSAAVFLLNR